MEESNQAGKPIKPCVETVKKIQQPNSTNPVIETSLKKPEIPSLTSKIEPNKNDLTSTPKSKSSIVVVKKPPEQVPETTEPTSKVNMSAAKTIIIPPTIGNGIGLKTLVKVVSMPNSRENSTDSNSSPKFKISSSVMSASSIPAFQLFKNNSKVEPHQEQPLPQNQRPLNNHNILSNLLNKNKSTQVQSEEENKSVGRFYNFPGFIRTSNSGFTTKVISIRSAQNSPMPSNAKIITVPMRSNGQQHSFVPIRPKEIRPAFVQTSTHYLPQTMASYGNLLFTNLATVNEKRDEPRDHHIESRKRKRKQDLSWLAATKNVEQPPKIDKILDSQRELTESSRILTSNNYTKLIKIVESPEKSPVKKQKSSPINLQMPTLFRHKGISRLH